MAGPTELEVTIDASCGLALPMDPVQEKGSLVSGDDSCIDFTGGHSMRWLLHPLLYSE